MCHQSTKPFPNYFFLIFLPSPLSYRFFAIYYFSLFFFYFFLLCGIVNVSVRLVLCLSVEFVCSTFRFSLAWLLMTN